MYEPRWWDPNLTGSTNGDEEKDYCTNAEALIKLSDVSTKATLLNIALTVLS